MQPVPQDLIDLSTALMESQDEDERAASQIVLLFSRLCNLFASSRDAAHIDRHDILAQAIALDDDLVKWVEELPPSFDYFTEASANSYSGYCEVYQSIFSAEVWNHYRGTRLGVNGIIIEQKAMLNMERAPQNVSGDLSGSPPAHPPAPDHELDIRFSVLESLRNDVCAATPFMLGRNSPNEDRKMTDIPLCKRTPVMHYMLFILRTAGITKEMSEWAKSQINELQNEKEVESGAVWNNSSMRISGD